MTQEEKQEKNFCKNCYAKYVGGCADCKDSKK